jgi:hypothetical protein
MDEDPLDVLAAGHFHTPCQFCRVVVCADHPTIAVCLRCISESMVWSDFLLDPDNPEYAGYNPPAMLPPAFGWPEFEGMKGYEKR